MMDTVCDIFSSKGYRVLKYPIVEGKRVDVLAVSGDETVAIECQVRPSVQTMKKRRKELLGHVDRLIFAIPHWAGVEQVTSVEVMKLPIPSHKDSVASMALIPVSRSTKARLNKIMRDDETYDEVILKLLEGYS
mgnify:CR=1 FL=1